MILVEFLRARLDEDAIFPTVAPKLAANTRKRMLAEVDAKRQIVDHAERWQETLYATPEGWTANTATAYRMAMQWTLELLATSWADHPDYDESWKP